jgi:hypothetical protein
MPPLSVGKSCFLYKLLRGNALVVNCMCNFLYVEDLDPDPYPKLGKSWMRTSDLYSQTRQGRYCTVPGGNIIPGTSPCPGGPDTTDEDPRGGGAQDARVPLPMRAVSQAVQQAGGHQEPLQVGLLRIQISESLQLWLLSIMRSRKYFFRLWLRLWLCRAVN